MKRQFLIAFWLFVAILPMSAQTLTEAWTSMPDSLLPHLEQASRARLIELANAGLTAEVDNKLHGKSRLDTLCQNFLQLTVSEGQTVQMKLLPTRQAEGQGRDSVICLVQTFKGPAAESRVRVFTRQWALLSDTCYREKSLLVKPDTLSADSYQQLLERIPLVMWEATLQADSDELLLTPSLPLMFVEEKEKMKPLLLQRNLKWNGEIFK